MGNEIRKSDTVLKAQELMSQKEEIENQLDDLEKQGIGMTEQLVDHEGFPRSDIDIVTVRTARAKIIALRNDHKAVMSEIEKALHAIHAENKANKLVEGNNDESIGKPKPFAIVNAIAPDSPAKEAGLTKGDRIIRFGYIHSNNNQNLNALNSFVAENVGVLERGETHSSQLIVLHLTPRHGWGGKGLLGCHILPI
ncbi:24365_t:CDS:2 [Entrophospora sp. SA101]|nr:24365_t:CDS:2 [Entrophospora sp. SA101]CAJ0836820.1 3975_t:CDS:2 [Entrophospora sp. SA101]CAJ0843627.1 16354_t:CDS:2 [Entrophospora sp. SA101]